MKSIAAREEQETAREELWKILFDFVFSQKRTDVTVIDQLIDKYLDTVPVDILQRYLVLYHQVYDSKLLEKRLQKLLKSARALPIPVLVTAFDILEASPKGRDVLLARRLLEASVNRYPREGEDLWLKFIAFEIQSGRPDEALKIHWQAMKAVASPESFSRRYQGLTKA